VTGGYKGDMGTRGLGDWETLRRGDWETRGLLGKGTWINK